MAWWNPFSWGKKPGRDKSLDSWEASNASVRVHRLARVPDHISRLGPKLIDTKPWLNDLMDEWRRIYSGFLVIQKKTRANYMTATRHTLSIIGRGELDHYDSRLRDFSHELEGLKGLFLHYKAQVERKMRRESHKLVRSALVKQRGESLVVYSKIQEVEKQVDGKIRLINKLREVISLNERSAQPTSKRAA
jgi:hypothetical protein